MLNWNLDNFLVQIKTSIKNKIDIFVFSVTIIAGILTVIIVFVFLNNFLVAQGKTSLETIAIEQSYEVLRVLEDPQKITAEIANQDEVLRYLMNENEEDSQNGDIANILDYFNINDDYSLISLVSNNGKVLTTTNEITKEIDYSGYLFYEEALKGRIYSGFSNEQVAGSDCCYYFSRPVFSDNGELIGIVLVGLKKHVVEETIRLFRKNEKISKVYLVDGYGNIIYSSDPDDVFKSIVDLSLEEEAEEPERLKNINTSRGLADLRLSRKDLLSISGQEAKVFDFYDEDGKPSIAAISKLEEFSFFVVIEEGKEEILAAIWGIIAVLSVVIMVIFILIAVFIHLFMGNCIGRIEKMNLVIRKIAEGDLSQRIRVTSDDELGRLGKSFNDMTSKLQDTLSSIESIVEEKTKTLQKTSDAMVGRELRMIELKKQIEDLELKKKDE